MANMTLSGGLDQLGINLPESAIEQLIAFETLLLKWNRTYNLTAIRDPGDVRIQHILDSLSILPWITQGKLLDVGSGGGLPGIPLAICKPELQVTLVDAVQKKLSPV